MRDSDLDFHLLEGGRTLGLTVHIDDAAAQRELAGFLRQHGASSVEYPYGSQPPRVRGRVAVTDLSITVNIDGLVVEAVTAPPSGWRQAERAVLFVADEPFDLTDSRPRRVLAAEIAVEDWQASAG